MNRPAGPGSLTALALAPGVLGTEYAALGERLDRDVVRAGAGAGHGQDRFLDGGVVERPSAPGGVGLL